MSDLPEQIRLSKIEGAPPGQRKQWQRYELDGKTLHQCRRKTKKEEEEEEGGEPNNQLSLNNPQATGAATTTPPRAGEKKLAAEEKKEEQQQDPSSEQASLSGKVSDYQIATLCEAVATLNTKIDRLSETVEALCAQVKSSKK